MFGKEIWDKLPESVFDNFDIARVKQGQNFKILKNHKGYSKNRPNQTYGYWLIRPNQQTLCIETNIF